MLMQKFAYALRWVGVAVAVICVATLSAWLYAHYPRLPYSGPPAPPVVQVVPTEEEAIVEAHKSLEHNKPAPQVAQTTDEYLCEVYKRTPTKNDGSDFTWKDIAAAKRKGMEVCAFVIGGMAPELKERLLAFGKAADGKGLKWSMLAGFRDDYRQSIATGFKARTGYSQHGGSKVTNGYGDGRAIDITAIGPIGPVLALVDSIGRRLGLIRPYKGNDPNHVQLSQPTQVAVTHAKPQKQRFAKIKGAEHKARYAKRFKQQVAARQQNDFFALFDFVDHGSTRAKPQHSGKMQRLRSVEPAIRRPVAEPGRTESQKANGRLVFTELHKKGVMF